MAGLSSEEIRKEEELANWRFVERSLAKAEGDDASAHINELRNHLARFPGGTTERYARTELEQLVWAGLGPSPEQAELEAYVSEFPTGKHTAEASSRIGFLKGKADAALEAEELKRQETEAWAKASGEDTKEAYEAFLREWPQSGNVRTARTRMRQLSGGEQKGAGVTRGLFLGLGLFVVLIYATL